VAQVFGSNLSDSRADDLAKQLMADIDSHDTSTLPPPASATPLAVGSPSARVCVRAVRFEEFKKFFGTWKTRNLRKATTNLLKVR
jgi:hypothetical protein